MTTASRIRQLLGLPLSPDEQRDLRGAGPMYPEEAGPGISSREPRWSEKMAGLLFGDQRRSMGQQRMADTVASLAGLTPLGALDASGPQEAAMAILPGAGGRMGKEAMGAAQAGIRAYHGSPHSFDKFELSPKTIGTGEGAQAYGHGLYFAGNEEVAQGYKQALSRRNIDVDYGGAKLGSQAEWAALIDNLNRRGSWREAKLLDQFGKTGGPVDDFVRQQKDWYRGDKEMEGALANFQNKIKATWMPGHMYEVNINARPEQFLDWDKPLAQQGESVKAFDDLYWNKYAKRNPDITQFMKSPEGSQAMLNEAGIPGIQYLDAGSRSAGQGTSNYVVFDDRLIDILRKYGLAGAAPLGGAAMLGGQEE